MNLPAGRQAQSYNHRTMKKVFLLTGCWLLVTGSFSFGQTVTQRLQKAFQQFESDSQLKYAISSLYVIDAKTGGVVFDKNSRVGLAGASTQKIITATTAFELLGKEFTYKTVFGIYKKEQDAFLYIKPSGDPTFGSWRWNFTRPEMILQNIRKAFSENGISGLNKITLDDKKFDPKVIPDGWIWQDLANYYGAGSSSTNWRENQFDILLRSGKNIGDPVEIVELKPIIKGYELKSRVTSAGKGTGDNAYVYFPLGDENGVITGTIPVNENRFTIAAAFPSSKQVFLQEMYDSLKNLFDPRQAMNLKPEVRDDQNSFLVTEHTPVIYTHYSPSLDSIIYWFLKKSINLYGEALIKTIAYEKKGYGSTDSGIAIVRKFWKDNGLDEHELNIYDGSGLSPLNRLTTHAQVQILQYARSKDWFPYFYDALPEYNGIKMKSGTISDVKGFCGYHKAKDGKEYIFSFLVNNYNGKTSGVVNKMFKVLDELK